MLTYWKTVATTKSSGLLLSIRFAKYSSGAGAGILKSPYGEVDVPNQTLSQFVWSKSENWKDKPALTCGVTGRSYTYEAIQALSTLGAKSLLANTGLKPGDRMGLLLPNIPEYLVAVHAALQAGLVVTFANPFYTVDELTRQFRDAKVRCIVIVPQLLEVARAVAKQLDGYDCTINIGGVDEPGEKILSLETLQAKPSRLVELPHIDPESVAVLPYSSGTTGIPKGVMLSHRNLLTNIVQFSHPSLLENGNVTVEQRKVLTALPFFHIYGFNAVVNYLHYFGMHVITMPKFTPQDYMACLAKYEPDALFVVPSLMLFLATHPEISAKHLAKVRNMFSGAAPLKRGLIESFYRKIERSDCFVAQGYGMTEMSPGVTFSSYNMPASKLGTCGRLLPSTEAKIVELDTGRLCGPNEPGELWIKGPQMMKGYLDNPKATSETVDSEGWLHTGDVVYYDEDEYFYVVDRTKELIKVKGNQVSPTELESLLLEIPQIADAAVVGVADPIAGELPKAYVVRKPGFDITADQVQVFIAPKVATYKKLAGGVSFVEAIPRNSSGKILRNELKNRSS